MAEKLGLSAAGRKLLSNLRVARHPDELHRDGLTEEALAALESAGLLERQSETTAPTDYQDVFGGWKSQRGMLIDHTRTLAFQRAIEAQVRPGDTVIDVGTGSGILAMMAARAGARVSYGLELTAMAAWARRLAAANGLDAMHVVQGDAADFAPDQPADVLIGEFAGYYYLEEWRHYAAFVRVRDAHLKPGGKVIPRAARMHLSAIDSRKIYQDRGYGFWEAPVYGFDLSAVREGDIAEPQRYIVTADSREIVATREIAAFDFLTGSERDYDFTAECEFTYEGAGSFHGFIGHFELDMGDGKVLSTSPFSRETCWHQTYFPMPQIQVPAGGRIALRVRSFFDPVTGFLNFGLAVAGPGEPLSEATPEQVFQLE